MPAIVETIDLKKSYAAVEAVRGIMTRMLVATGESFVLGLRQLLPYFWRPGASTNGARSPR